MTMDDSVSARLKPRPDFGRDRGGALTSLSYILRCCAGKLAATIVLGCLVGCGEPEGQDLVHSHGADDGHGHGHGHAHVAPHGGAAVVLGEEMYHLEFVLDVPAASLHCYVLDGHMERFVRIAAEGIEVEIDGEATVALQPVESRATGETVGDTSHFIAPVSWADEKPRFDAVVKEITVKGNRFGPIPFRYPEGNESE